MRTGSSVATPRPRPLLSLTRGLGLGAVLAAAAVGLRLAPATVFAAWLAAWWFCLGLMFGARAMLWMHRLTGGVWGEALRPATLPLIHRLPRLLLLFVPLLAGMQQLYPWAGSATAMPAGSFAAQWFGPAFFGLRLLAYGLGLLWLAQPARLGSAGRAAAALGVYLLLASFAAIDLLMSLTAGWASSVFGWLAISSQLSGGTALAIVIAARSGGAVPTAPGAPPVWRDLGNLLLMLLLVQGYLQYMQFLVIWAENLPREISWYLPRLQTGWRVAGLGLIAGQLVLPVLALLFRRIKDDPRRLARVATAVVAMQALQAAWLVMPSVAPHDPNAWWLLPLAFGGLGRLCFGHLPLPPARRAGAADEVPDAR